MIEMNIEQIKSVQLDILDAIHKFCCENNIKYSLACGTLLGARRHGGYIPWDDDIDIYLLRDDYDKLMSTFPEVYIGICKIVSLERDARWDRAYAKGYHCGTEFREATTSDYPLGVCIDIFPVDAVPASDDERRRYNRIRLFWQKVYSLKSMKFSKKRSFAKNAVLAVGKAVILPLSLRRIARHIDLLSQQYNDTASEYVFENVLGVVSQRPFACRLFDSLTEIAFEGRVYCAFADSDCYLSNTYGDWRKLPPVEKQITHHTFRAYWK